MTHDTVIRTAEFNPKVCTYWILNFTIVLTVTVVGIPLLLIWLPLGYYFTKRYLERMECILTEKELKVNKGIFVRVEKTIPLEKITDLGMVQGPIMRHFGIHQLTIETAGQSSQGPLASLTGIVDVKGFRQAVMEQRDSHKADQSIKSPETVDSATIDNKDKLNQIHQTLLRIEELLKKR